MRFKLCSKIPCNCILIAMGLSHWHTWCNRWTLAKLPGRSKAEQTAESSLPWPFFFWTWDDSSFVVWYIHNLRLLESTVQNLQPMDLHRLVKCLLNHASYCYFRVLVWRIKIAVQHPPSGQKLPLKNRQMVMRNHFPGIQQLEVRRRNLARKSVQRDEEALGWEGTGRHVERTRHFEGLSLIFGLCTRQLGVFVSSRDCLKSGEQQNVCVIFCGSLNVCRSHGNILKGTDLLKFCSWDFQFLIFSSFSWDRWKSLLGSPGLSRVTVFKCDSPWAEIQQVKQLKDSNAQMQATWHGLNIGMI